MEAGDLIKHAIKRKIVYLIETIRGKWIIRNCPKGNLEFLNYQLI